METSVAYFAEIEKAILKFTWKHKRLKIAQEILKKKNKAGGNILPHFKIYYKTTIIKAIWHCYENRYIDKWNRIESLKLNPHKYSVFDPWQGCQEYTMGKR